MTVFSKNCRRKLLELAQLAKRHELNFTVDAEEADRLELSLDVIAAVLRDYFAGRMGWLRTGDTGLSKTRRRSDRLGRRGGEERSIAV